jgi:SAM-dependent methyltransferase
VDDAELRARIESFSQWHYEFDLNGHRTPIVDHAHINRHRQRKSYFFDQLVRICGGSLEGKRVLDLGCNAGFWSLCAIENGCDFVLGIDARQMHIDQANLVFEVNDIDPARYQFIQGSVFDTDVFERGPFDVVLCLGLLYHVSKPVTLTELISAVNSDLLLIDTCLSRVPGAYFAVRREPLGDPRHAIDHELVTWPTRGAVLALARQFGYSAVVLKPSFTNWEGCYDFRARFRRAFLCSKRSPLPATLHTESADARAAALDLAADAWDRVKIGLRSVLRRDKPVSHLDSFT